MPEMRRLSLARPRAGTREGATPRAKEPRAGALVLVVEDDGALRTVLAEILTWEGYAVATASHGEDALGCFAHGLSPALILTDLLMPVMDGWTLVRELQSRGDLTPILLLGASTELATWAAELGVAGWVQKPFALDDLLLGVRRCLHGCASN